MIDILCTHVKRVLYYHTCKGNMDKVAVIECLIADIADEIEQKDKTFDRYKFLNACGHSCYPD
jgi:hypothetical protein